MPFTLAHPAAVLPLRRFLWFPGLVAGAMAPDLGYYVPVLPTHDVLGGCLAAVVLLLVGRLLLPSVMALAPEFVRTRVTGLAERVGRRAAPALQRDRVHVVARRPRAAGLDSGPLSERARLAVAYRKSRYKFWIFVALAAAIGVTWSLSDPVSQISLYDWVRRILLGLVQGVCAAIAVHAVLWSFAQSRHDRR